MLYKWKHTVYNLFRLFFHSAQFPREPFKLCIATLLTTTSFHDINVPQFTNPLTHWSMFGLFSDLGFCLFFSLVSWPRMEPVPPAEEGQNLNHLTARKVPVPQKFGLICIYCCNHTIYLNKTKLMKSDCKKEKVMFWEKLSLCFGNMQ